MVINSTRPALRRKCRKMLSARKRVPQLLSRIGAGLRMRNAFTTGAMSSITRPGDWDCTSCNHLNFSRRDTCQRCGNQRSDGDPGDGFAGGRSYGGVVRPGDWFCSSCKAHNFASRNSCFKCAAVKDETAVDSASGGDDRPGWKSGDWMCTRSGCNEHNFASRTQCFRCDAPRESAASA